MRLRCCYCGTPATTSRAEHPLCAWCADAFDRWGGMWISTAAHKDGGYRIEAAA